MYILVEAEDGESIDETAKNMCRLADKLNCGVKTVFNFVCVKKIDND